MTQQLQTAQYDSLTTTRVRRSRNGLAAMPVGAAFPAAQVVVALNGGQEMEAFAFVAVRRGQPPVIPAAWSSSVNRVFFGGEQSGAIPVPDPGGIMNYVLSGWFAFYILSPEGLNTDFYLGTTPWSGLDKNEVIEASLYFSTQIVNPNYPRILSTTTPSTPLSGLDIAVLRAGNNR
jgi:hypothetical protein